jgi:hypothetical protein
MPSIVVIHLAHFVTAVAIDLKLYTFVPLGQMTSQNKFRSDLIHGLVTRGPNPKTQNVYHKDAIFKHIGRVLHCISISSTNI